MVTGSCSKEKHALRSWRESILKLSPPHPTPPDPLFSSASTIHADGPYSLSPYSTLLTPH